MRFHFTSLLVSLPVLASGAFGAAVAAETHPTQPGSGPHGAHNPTGLFGLVKDEAVYRMYCNRSKPLHGDYVRPYACFDTEVLLSRALSAPNPERLTGYINNDGTNAVLFAGQIVTLGERLEIHVEKTKKVDSTCSRVKIYELPKWKLEIDEQVCPGDDKPIKL